MLDRKPPLCPEHDTQVLRLRPRAKACPRCGTDTSYVFRLCADCARSDRSCVLCGKPASVGMLVPILCTGGYGPTVEDQSVDPRDIEIEWDAAKYRVYFWSQDGGRCEEHELSGARDVREVIAWAESNAAGRVPEIFVRHDHPPQHGLIRLAGGRPGVV